MRDLLQSLRGPSRDLYSYLVMFSVALRCVGTSQEGRHRHYKLFKVPSIYVMLYIGAGLLKRKTL